MRGSGCNVDFMIKNLDNGRMRMSISVTDQDSPFDIIQIASQILNVGNAQPDSIMYNSRRQGFQREIRFSATAFIAAIEDEFGNAF